MNAIPPYRLLKKLEQALHAVSGIGSTRHEKYKHPDEYRLAIRKVLQELKDTTIEIMQSGHFEAIKAAGNIGDRVSRECSQFRDPDFNEVFWDELTDFYPQTEKSYSWQRKGLPHETELKLFTRAVEHAITPSKVIRTDLNDYQGALFLDLLTMVVEKLSMPYRKIDLSLEYAFDYFKKRLNDRDFQTLATDHMLAHQSVYFPVIEQLLSICELEATYDRESRSGEHHRDTKNAMFKLLDHGPDDQIYSFEIPAGDVFKNLKKSLSWPAEFLADLYDINPHPVIIALAEMAFDLPEGPIPYLHFERMGIVRSPEWHAENQESRSYSKQIPLYEYAIYKPGIEVSVNWIKNTNTNLSSERMVDFVRLLEAVKTKDPEALRKSQVLFDALVDRASERSESWMMKKIKESSLDPRYFAKHSKLRGELLEDRLGL
jgi:hypothetical protein